MPTILTQALAGATIARIAGTSPLPRALPYVAAFAAMAPDADVAAFRWGVPYQSVLGHRGLTHSLAFAIAVGLIGTCWRRIECRVRWRVAICLALATASHGVLDAFTNGGRGVAFLAPFSGGRFFFPVTPIEVSPIGVEAFFSARGMSVLISEMIWVWVPLLIVNAVVRTVRVRRAPS